MLLVRTYLAPSCIEGLGVHAGQFIAAGTVIWGLNPKFDIFIHESEIPSLPEHVKSYIARYSYPHLEMPGVVVLDSDDGKFMNHSETPNTDFSVFSRGVALRDIAEGEELTCNYAEFDPSFRGFMPAMQAVRRPEANGAHRPTASA